MILSKYHQKYHQFSFSPNLCMKICFISPMVSMDVHASKIIYSLSFSLSLWRRNLFEYKPHFYPFYQSMIPETWYQKRNGHQKLWYQKPVWIRSLTIPETIYFPLLRWILINQSLRGWSNAPFYSVKTKISDEPRAELLATFAGYPLISDKNQGG